MNKGEYQRDRNNKKTNRNSGNKNYNNYIKKY